MGYSVDTIATELAQCGFSYDNVAFCNKKKGEKEYLTYISNLLKGYDYQNNGNPADVERCHFMSRHCSAFIKKTKKKNWNKY